MVSVVEPSSFVMVSVVEPSSFVMVSVVEPSSLVMVSVVEPSTAKLAMRSFDFARYARYAQDDKKGKAAR
jgi:hypothetical protein